jgi:hypothetical protein
MPKKRAKKNVASRARERKKAAEKARIAAIVRDIRKARKAAELEKRLAWRERSERAKRGVLTRRLRDQRERTFGKRPSRDTLMTYAESTDLIDQFLKIAVEVGGWSPKRARDELWSPKPRGRRAVS